MSFERHRHLVVAFVAVLAHATALGGGFVWLDHAHILDGQAIAPWTDWSALFTQGFAGTGFYRPLMSVSLSLDALLGGAPWLYHATSIAWHAAASALTVSAAGALGLSPRTGLLAGVLFAVHPATSLVAGAIAFRSESMIAVALLAVVVLHLRGRRWAAAAALLGGALVKETALVLGPLVVAALELGPRAGMPDVRTSGGKGERLRRLVPMAAAVAVALALRALFAPAWRAAFVPLSRSEAVGARLASVVRSALLVIPVDRTICDASPIVPAGSLAAASGAVLLGALAYLAWKRRGPALLMGLAFLPSLNLVPIMRWWSPHYLYVPLAFAAMLAAEVIVRRGRRAQALAVAAAAVCGGLALGDGLRFRSDHSLWAGETAARPACREGWFYLGEVARRQGNLDQAATHYEAALAEPPRTISYVDRGAALQNLGVTRLEQGRLPEARSAFQSALALASDETERRRLTHNLATAELRAGNAAEAARLLAPELERGDPLPESILVRHRALVELGRTDEAAALVRRVQALAGEP